MKKRVRIELQPLGVTFEVEAGTPLQDCLFPYGVEFPCGGRGRCKGCRVRVLSGDLPVGPEEQRVLTPEEISEGWRLACRSNATDDLALEIAQWETTVLADDSTFEFEPGTGLGVTVDLGTTTLVAQLLDRTTGHVLGVRTALNPQARHGSDVMTRIQFAVAEAGQKTLEQLIRGEIGGMVHQLLESSRVHAADLRDVVIVGNTVMHHLFCGIDVEPLSHFPFETPRGGLQELTPTELDWELEPSTRVRFLPCLGSFVGSDILAGIVATRMHATEELTLLVDLGTNGEIAIGNRHRLLCSSTAAGPAFEGARISMGMRAATGAIARVSLRDEGIRCHVLGHVAPRGICGSGLVDAVAVGLELGRIRPSGRFADGSTSWPIEPPVAISQQDIRELQLAKGAIAAGIHRLLEHWGAAKTDVRRVYLAGAFGNYVNLRSAERLGLLDFPEEAIRPAGNTALLGAKVALFNHGLELQELRRILEITRHVGLSCDPRFEETYVDEMTFPEATGQTET